LKEHVVNSLKFTDLGNEHSVLAKSFPNKLRKQAGNYDDFAQTNQEEIIIRGEWRVKNG
jgi:hypothetical protein